MKDLVLNQCVKQLLMSVFTVAGKAGRGGYRCHVYYKVCNKEEATHMVRDAADFLKPGTHRNGNEFMSSRVCCMLSASLCNR